MHVKVKLKLTQLVGGKKKSYTFLGCFCGQRVIVMVMVTPWFRLLLKCSRMPPKQCQSRAFYNLSTKQLTGSQRCRDCDKWWTIIQLKYCTCGFNLNLCIEAAEVDTYIFAT